MAHSIDDLRNHLFDALQLLKDGKIDVSQAKAISDLSQTIINSAKVEVDYLRATEQVKGTGFIPDDGYKSRIPDPKRRVVQLGKSQ